MHYKFIQALPSILDGNNAVIQGETGSGKSLCYIIPVMNEILNSKEQLKELREDVSLPLSALQRGAIILAPTKELCA